jgi:hypothetical protein
MPYRFLANCVLSAHLLFIVFVFVGGFAVLRWRWVAWLHLPAMTWGMLVEFTGWYCPLTQLEIHFLRLAGEAGYSGGFVARYLLATIYPEGLTRSIQIVLGASILAVNGLIYGCLIWKAMRSRGEGTASAED